MLIGYLVGVGGALLGNPSQTMAPLTLYLMASCVAAMAALIGLVVRALMRSMRPELASAHGAVTVDIEASEAEFAPTAKFSGAGERNTAKTPSERAVLLARNGKTSATLSTPPIDDADPLAGHQTKPGDLAALISLLETMPEPRPKPAPLSQGSNPRDRQYFEDFGQGEPDAEKPVVRQPRNVERSPLPPELLAQARAEASELAAQLPSALTSYAQTKRAAQRQQDLFDAKDEKTPAAAVPANRGQRGPDLSLDDVLSPAIAVQSVRLLPQRKLMMIDLDVKGGHKARRFWLQEELSELIWLDRAIVANAKQTLTEILPAHPAQALLLNLSTASLNDGQLLDDLRDLAALGAGSHLRVTTVVSPSEGELIDLSQVRDIVPEPLEIGLHTNQATSWLPEELASHQVKELKITADSLLPAGSDGELDRSLALRIDGFTTRGINLVVTGIDRKPTLLDLLDYPVRLGQGSLLGSQTIKAHHY